MTEKPKVEFPLLKAAVELESAAFIMSSAQQILAEHRHQKATEVKRLRDRLNSIIRYLRDAHVRTHGRS